MRSKLFFSFFPAGNVELASSRIRVYEFQSALHKRGIEAIIGFSIKANVLFFQKKVTKSSLWLAHIAKIFGKIVIYDVDDLGDALFYYSTEKNFSKMIKIADIVSTCSLSQLEYLGKKYNINNCTVVYNAIDYFPLSPVKLKINDSYKIRIVWFGSSSNFHLFEKYLPTLLEVENSIIIAIVGHYSIEEYSRKYPTINFFPWSLCGMISLVQSCDIACLMHDGNDADLAKGNNKMISAITWGVPAVVSRTPEYERTAREAGIEYALFSDEEELHVAIEKLRSPVAREQYLNAAQPIIWRQYSPDVIALEYLDLVYAKLESRLIARAGRFLLRSIRRISSGVNPHTFF